MTNILKPLKRAATLHDAAVNAKIIENEKIGKFIPKEFSSASTASTIAKIAKTTSKVRMVKCVAAQAAVQSVALAGVYIAMKHEDFTALPNRKIITVSSNINNHLPNNFKAKEYSTENIKSRIKAEKLTNIQETKSIVDTVKEMNLSVKK